jgi:Cdc6-like AAA superfamily ATPase
MSVQDNRDELIEQQARVNAHFSPAAPVDSLSLFAGRQRQIEMMLDAMMQRGQHAILYGERGVGKTSLARLMNEIASRAQIEGFKFCTVNCAAEDRYENLWKRVLRELRFTYAADRIGFIDRPEEKSVSLCDVLEAVCGKESIGPEDIRYTLQVVKKSFIIIDELDRLQDPQSKTLLADTIKTLSDNSVDCTILLVGVADSVDQLIKEHASVERALVQVHMPRMSHDEIFDLLDRALKAAGMTVAPEAKLRIAELARGLPHYAHLLGQYAALTALRDGRNQIGSEDVRAAMRETVMRAQSGVQTAYHTATSSPRKNNLFAQVLLACAMTDCDELGYFSAADVCRSLSRILQKDVSINAFSQHLKDFCEQNRGYVLQRKGQPRSYRYRFTNPLIVPFVILKGFDMGLIEDLWHTKQTLFD